MSNIALAWEQHCAANNLDSGHPYEFARFIAPYLVDAGGIAKFCNLSLDEGSGGALSDTSSFGDDVAGSVSDGYTWVGGLLQLAGTHQGVALSNASNLLADGTYPLSLSVGFSLPDPDEVSANTFLYSRMNGTFGFGQKALYIQADGKVTFSASGHAATLLSTTNVRDGASHTASLRFSRVSGTDCIGSLLIDGVVESCKPMSMDADQMGLTPVLGCYGSGENTLNLNSFSAGWIL